MNDHYILDADKNPVAVDFERWVVWFSENERRVAWTERAGVQVSTVFLGLDHQFGLGDPVLFETMVFGGEHDQYQERYSTWDEAVAGHEAAVALVFGTSDVAN